jgi:hypothetical protein
MVRHTVEMTYTILTAVIILVIAVAIVRTGRDAHKIDKKVDNIFKDEYSKRTGKTDILKF